MIRAGEGRDDALDDLAQLVVVARRHAYRIQPHAGRDHIHRHVDVVVRLCHDGCSFKIKPGGCGWALIRASRRPARNAMRNRPRETSVESPAEVPSRFR